MLSRHQLLAIRLLPALLICCQACSICVGAGAPEDDRARRILGDAGVEGGLVVHVGCADGRLTAALRTGPSFLVHGLDTDPQSVEQARRHIESRGLYGEVAVDTLDGRRLPYVDNLVNLLVTDDLGRVPMQEVIRVLAPGGVAMIGEAKTIKPWPDGIDQWSHYLHGPDNNAVAQDRVVGPPRHMQWLARPMWTRHHHADKGTYPTIRAVVSSRGRLFYMVDQTKSSNRTVPSKWFLAARDGFSGVLLWERPLEAESFERRLEQVWRTLIADGDRVYAPLGVARPLSALDAATGEVIRSYPGTDGLQEVIQEKKTLFVVRGQGGILALEAQTGDRLWQWEPDEDDAIVPLTLAAAEGKVFLKTDKGASCLSADDGKTLWTTPLEGPQKKARLRFPRERLLVADGVVLCSYGGKDPTSLNRDRFEYLGSHPRVHEYAGKLAALSAEDGRLLWRADYLPGLESTPGEIYVTGGRVWLGPDFAEPRDLHTGKVAKNRPVIQRLWTTGHHYRCYPGKATCRYILTAKRGIEMIDLVGENHSRNNWVRATCRVGVTPANGLLYAPPHSCGCYMEAKLYGFWALAPERHTEDKAQSVREIERLRRGPACGHLADEPSAAGDSTGWCTYRGNPARSGSSTSPLPSNLEPRWEAHVGGRLSAVTVADGRLLVAQIDAHTVHALGADSGKALWRFTAGARVDSPPTLHRGLALFGCRDGWVYCLRASDGTLAWRFLAAPQIASAVANEQVESLWPVHGSVLIHNGIAYVAAGRSSYLDGGIVLYGLDPQTGKQRCTTSLKSKHAGALKPPPEDERAKMQAAIRQNNTDYKTFLGPDRSDAFSMRGALPDVLVANGESVFLRHLRFDDQLARLDEKRPHLFSTSSLLDDSEHHRSYWVLGTGDFSRTPVAYPWIVSKSLAVPYGLMMVFDDKTAWQVRRVVRKADPIGYALFATPRPRPSQEESALADFQERSSANPPAAHAWTTGLLVRPRAMVRANDCLFVAGMPDHGDPERTAPADNARLENRQAGLLHVFACSDGETRARVALESPPVWDGMAVANNRLFIASTDGTVRCWQAR